MIRIPSLAALLVAILPGISMAQETTSCALSYETYEVSVPHTDLETCPASMDMAEAYCRVSIVAEVATVFAFSEADDCLITARSYFEDEFDLTFD